MQTTCSKVTDIHAFGRRARMDSAAGGPLAECRDTAAGRLAEALRESLAGVAEALLGMAEKAAALDMYHLHLDARDLASRHADDIGRVFQARFLADFERRCQRAPTPAPVEDEARLALVEPDDLEVSLAGQALATAIANACAEELFGLGQRVGLLIDRVDLTAADNPLGPDCIASTVIEALNGLEDVRVAIKVRLLVASMLNRRLPERVKVLYQDLNRQLAQHGVLPTLRVGLRHAGRASGGNPADTADNGQSVFATLSRLIHSGHVPAGLVESGLVPGYPAPGQVLSVGLDSQSLGIALDQLQHGDGQALGIDAGQLASGAINVLHGLRQAPLLTRVAAPERVTLDVVAMLFDYILDDARIPDAMKAQIGRLQIPILRLAMRDKDFFAHKQHPARALLDSLAEAAIGWDAREGHTGGLYRKVTQLVQAVIDDYAEDIAIFTTTLDDLRAYLAGEADTAQHRIGQGARAVQDLEHAEAAARAAADALNARLAGATMPAWMREHIQAWWQPWLADRHAAGDDAAWASALGNLEDLIWSLRAKTDDSDRRRFLALLPGLIQRLRADLDAMAIATSARDDFFGALVDCHAEAVRGDPPAVAEPALPAPAVLALAPAPVAGEFTELNIASAPTPAPVAASLPATEATTPTAATHVTPDLPAGASEGVSGLRRGDWIEYTHEDGTAVRVRLFWISPMQTLYLFSNRLGQRAISISAAGLASKLARGEARRLDATPLVDRAMDRLLNRLQQGPA